MGFTLTEYKWESRTKHSPCPQEASWQQHAPVQRLHSWQYYFGTETEASHCHLIKRLKNTSWHPKGQFSDHWRSGYSLIHKLEVKSDDKRAKRLFSLREAQSCGCADLTVGSDLPSPGISTQLL